MMMKSHLYAIDIDKKKVQNTFFITLEPLWKSALNQTQLSGRSENAIYDGFQGDIGHDDEDDDGFPAKGYPP